MKKVLCISIAALLVFALSACVKNGDNPSDAQEASDVAKARIAASSAPEPGVSSNEPGAPNEQASSGSIVAESSNTVSDKETEAILDELSTELDGAASGAENLEDLDNSDLDVNNIE